MTQKTWYEIWLDNGIEKILLAKVRSPGLASLTVDYYRTVYPEDRKFKVWKA